MWIVTAKIPWRRLRTTALCLLVLCGCLLTVSPNPVITCASSVPGLPEPSGVRTNRDRIDYLAAFGWTVDPDPISTEEIRLPREMDEPYLDYIALQNSQGFEPERYAGRRAKRYSYHITNYPSGEQEVQANLLICRGRVIAGEVLSPRLDGFLHGLSRPRGPDDSLPAG